MIANYHTHTVRCRHASGTEEEYVQTALEAELKILGFSDHTPYWFGCDYYSTYRMFPDQLEDYIASVLDLRQRYASQLDIRLGLEAEYYPAYFEELVCRLKDTPVEYLILGQHFVGNEIGDHYNGWPTADTQILSRYCSQTADAMYTGAFSYLAHPDLIQYTGSRKKYREHMRTICKAANDCGLPLEINFLGIKAGRNYPNPEFWAVAGEEGCKAVFGCDAHMPQGLFDPEGEKRAMKLAQKYGLEVVQTVPLRRI